jgi:DNA-binding NtrC family response regulator
MERAAILGNGMHLDVTRALGVGTADADSIEAAPRYLNNLQTGNSSAKEPSIGTSPAAAFQPLDVAMKRHIEAALERTRGRIEGPTGAAKILNINPHTLRARMRKLKIQWQGFRGV